MATGKLYRLIDNTLIGDVNCRFFSEEPTNWWGELILTGRVSMGDEAGCIIEFEDKRKGKCRLRKKVNHAVTGVPPRYVYHFTGTSLLE